MTLFDGSGNVLHEISSQYAGKYISILGDSISTYAGYVPEGNEVYYTGSNAGVDNVSDIWWNKLLCALDAKLLVNNAWSGSLVTTANGETSAGCMTRCEKLHKDAENPDIIIVYLGINDFHNGVALGSYEGSGSFPTATTTFREAYAIMLNKILTRYPKAQVWVCTLPYCERTGNNTFPEVNGNSIPLAIWNQAIRELADIFGVNVLEYAKCGLTYQNMNLYMGDYSAGDGLHPNAAGHSFLANQAIRQLDPFVRKRFA